MKHFLFLILVILLTLTTIGCDGSENKSAKSLDMSKIETEQINTTWDSISYSFGFNTGMRLIKDTLPLNQTLYMRGIIDAFDSLRRVNDRLMADEGIEASFKSFDSERKSRAEKGMRMEKIKDSTRAANLLVQGKELLAKNAKDPDIKMTPSGLQYKVIKEGDGARPKSGEAAQIHFIGSLTDGEEYANTYVPKQQPGMPELTEEQKKEKPKPIVVPVDKVPPGWSEALKLMKTGSKYIFYIPSELMYGTRGMIQERKTIIPPNAVLIMEMEMFGPVPLDQTIDPRAAMQQQGGMQQPPQGGMPPQGGQQPPQGGRR